MLVTARNAAGKGGQDWGNMCIFERQNREIARRVSGAKDVKAGSEQTKLRSQRHDGRGFQGEGPPPVVSDVAQTQQSAPSHMGADVPAGRQVAPESPHSPSLPRGTPVRHYLRQEPGALAARAGICAGGCRVTGIPTATGHRFGVTEEDAL